MLIPKQSQIFFWTLVVLFTKILVSNAHVLHKLFFIFAE